jgi:uncharacterized OB-fold protein
MWSADFNDAPNLVDEALAEVHQLKKDFTQWLAALESKLNRMKCPNCGKRLWFVKSYCVFCKTPFTEEGRQILETLEKERAEKATKELAESAMKFLCPVCSALMMATQQQAAAGLRCEKCGTGFVPEKPFEEPPPPVEEPPPLAPVPHVEPEAEIAVEEDGETRRQRIRNTAENFAGAGKIIAILGILICGLSLFVAIGGDDSRMGFVLAILSGSLISIGIWLYLIGQIIHIRANTEK